MKTTMARSPISFLKNKLLYAESSVMTSMCHQLPSMTHHMKRCLHFVECTNYSIEHISKSRHQAHAPTSKLLALLTVSLTIFAIGCSSSSDPTPIAQSPSAQMQDQEPLTADEEALRLQLLQVAEAAASDGFSGSVLVMANGKELLVSSHGLANRDNNTPITETTAFDLSTVAMEFTAAAIYKLQEQGMLNLSDSIGSILPDAPADKADITIQALLRHRAGIAQSHSSGNIFEPMDRLEARQRIFDQPLDFEPGTNIQLSFSGYTLLADIIQEVSQRDYAEFVRTELFVPAGLEHTGFYGDDIWQSDQTAIGYDSETFGDNNPANWPYTWAAVGSGGLVSSVRDFNRWLTSTSSGTVLSPATFAAFHAQRPDHFDLGTEDYGDENAVFFPAEGEFGQLSLTGESLGNGTRIMVMSNASDGPSDIISLSTGLTRTIFEPEPAGGLTVPLVFQNAIDNGFSGAVLVRYRGEVLLNSAAGFADREAEIAFTTDTVSTMGSITKQYTGALIMALQEAGLLSVEDRLSDHFADVPADKADITIHQLLTHTAGIDGDLGGDDEPIGRDDYLQLFWATPLEVEPGAEFIYSNVGYSIAAAIAEIVTGQSYEVALNERLLAPAGITETGYILPDRTGRTIADGYRGSSRITDFGSNWGEDGPTWHLRGNGGLLTTTNDFLKWHDALAGESVLTTSSIEALQASHVDEGFGGSFYGYGWVTEETPAGPLRWHNGGNGFHFANFLRFTDEDLVVVMLANEENRASDQLVWQLARAASPALRFWTSPNE